MTETNRKCPRWAEFNSGTAPVPPTPSSSANSPPPMGGGLSGLGFIRPGASSFGFPAAVSSPLATSPPLSAMDEDATPSAPKIKLTLKRT